MISLRTSRGALMLALFAVAALAAGCASIVRLRNPETGLRAACEGGFRAEGLGGVMDGSAWYLQTQCVKEYQNLGYVKVE